METNEKPTGTANAAKPSGSARPKKKAKPSAKDWKRAAEWRDLLNTPAWLFAAADALHGWKLDAKHEGDNALRMTQRDYKAALERAARPVPEAAKVVLRGGQVTVDDYIPHLKACSKHAPTFKTATDATSQRSN